MSYRYYRNNEGYPDPTAGAAIYKVMREQSKQRKPGNYKQRSRERQRANRRLKRQREAIQKQLLEKPGTQLEVAE